MNTLKGCTHPSTHVIHTPQSPCESGSTNRDQDGAKRRSLVVGGISRCNWSHRPPKLLTTYGVLYAQLVAATHTSLLHTSAPV